MDSFEVTNGTRWDLDFNMTTAPVPTRVIFDNMPSYKIKRKKTLKKGKMKVNGIFKLIWLPTEDGNLMKLKT